MEVAITLILGALASLLAMLYLYLTRNHGYWESRGVFCKTPEFFFGNIRQMSLLKVSRHDFIRGLYNEMKGRPFFGLYEGSRPTLVLMDPELIKLVLIKHFDHFTDRQTMKFKSNPVASRPMIALKGDDWKRTRVACSPAFSSGRIKAMVPHFDECGKQMIEYLHEATTQTGSAELNARKLLINYTLNSIAASAFGLNLNTFAEKNSLLVEKALNFQNLSRVSRVLIIICMMCEVPEWITSRLPVSFFNFNTTSFFGGKMMETRNYRKNNNIRRNDLLQVLLDAQAAPVEVIGDLDEDITNEKREVLDEITSIAQSIFFFIAGYETTSSNLSTACYELARNKAVQQKAREDVLEYWPKHVANLTYEAAVQMSYVDMVVTESSRLYPPGSTLERICTKPIELSGIKLECGSKVMVPSYGLHLDPEYYPDPFTFRPERFSPEEKRKRNPYVYLAFGAGPRNCLGLRFAHINSTVCLAYLLKHYEIDVCDKTPESLEADPRAFLFKSKEDIYLKFKRIH